MLFGEITIIIEVDETKLTKDQKEQSDKADTDLSVDHPVDNGIENLMGGIEALVQNTMAFNYLGDGKGAVDIKITQ